jgi:hypothetical protein
MFLENLRLAIAQPAIPSSSGELDDDVIDEIVGSQSHGNIWLQLAEFYLREDVDADYERFKDYKFSD